MSGDFEFQIFVTESFTKYIKCDWGDMDNEDKKMNDYAVKYGKRIMGSYIDPSNTNVKIWIITEADRSATTILFPSEY